ncbi:hypothetical protein A8C32_01765 [Flavivirga aquatica]|uniref:Secretion system C-terminal sorting domain-containing protein n=2 Tax=Flavivirga aquatica TaxID=1849968 RepID=A0A1E5T9Z9_9FLAO|nr:hypothetical protein A8C32_01765 [Flavivirga aquatica]
MLSILCFLVTLFFTQLSTAQVNLVKNPSFEQGAIPNGVSELHFATYWSHYKGECIPNNPNIQSTFKSSDLFDEKSLSPQVGIPNNKFTTSAGLPERTGKKRYAGIYTAVYPPASASDERIRGTLANKLQAGGYNLSLYLARAKNFYGGSNPQLDPVNYYNVEVVLRKGNSCSQSKIIYSSPSVTNFQWQQYGTSFVITQAEANIYDKVEVRLKIWPLEKMGNDNARAILIDDVSISQVVCNLNTAFSANITCHVSSNTVSINVSNNGTNPNGVAHQYEILEMSSLSIADANVISTLGHVNAASGSYSVPNVGGKYYMIKHGVWTATCSWKEQRKVLEIPFSFNGAVNSNFSGDLNTPSSGSPYIKVKSTMINTTSNWIVFKNTVNTYPNLSSWSLHTLVNSSTPTHNYNVPNVQHGMFYLVRHISRTNCSQIDYTDKIFYVFAKHNVSGQGKSGLSYNLVSEKRYEVSETEHKESVEKVSRMKQETNKNQLIQFYSNSSRDQVFIKGDLSLDGAQVDVTNIYGKTVYSNIWITGDFINVSSWNKGIYIVRIKTEKEIISKKVVIE